MSKRVVITGIGIISPYGIGKKSFQRALDNGKSAISRIRNFDTKEFGCKKAGIVPDFNIKKLLKTKGLRSLTRTTQLALVAVKEALDDASLPRLIPESKTDSYGVALGISSGSIKAYMDLDRQITLEGPRSIDPLFFANSGPNASASQIAMQFNIKGFNATIATFATSGLDAAYYAMNMIKNHSYKVVLAGASEELSQEVYAGLIRVQCLAGSRSAKHKEISRPYDKQRKGIIVSEGSCIFVLEDLDHAKKRNARIYAELKGYGFAFDTKTKKGFSLSGEDAAESIRQALAESGCSKDDISCVIGSANSSPGCDYTEAKALRTVFADRIKSIPVTSIKSMLGEAFSAGGSFNMAAAINSLKSNFIPPTINYKHPDKKCGLNIVGANGLKKTLSNVLVTSFVHNGYNASVVLGKI